MKAKSLTLAVFFLCLAAHSQAPEIQWQKNIGGSLYDIGTYLVQTPDGGYMVGGTVSSNDGDITSNHGQSDCLIIKTDANGTIEWQKAYGGTGNESFRSIAPTSDGGYIFSANASSNDGDVTGNHGASDMWIVRINAIGDIQWQKTYGGSNNDSSGFVSQTSDGGYIVSGIVTSTDGDVFGHHGGLRDCWVAKLNNVGTIVWSRTLGGSSDEAVAYKILETSDGGFIFVSYTSSNNGNVIGNNGDYDAWVVKLFSNGFTQWQKCYGGSGGELATDIIVASDGGYIISGASNSNDLPGIDNHGGMCYWILKIDTLGNIQWQKSYGSSGLGHAMSVKATTDGGYIVGGYINRGDFDVTGHHGNLDAWLIKLDVSGTMQWQKSFGGSGEDSSEYIIQTQDGGFAFTGGTRSSDGDVTTNHGVSDIWIVKLSEEELSNANFQKEAITIYPNPNRGKFTIDYNEGNLMGNEVIIIYNLLGQVVYNSSIRQNQTSVDLSSNPNGIFICKIIRDNKEIKVQKIVVNK